MVVNPVKNRDKYLFAIKSIDDYDGRVRIEKIAKRRTSNQNSYLHVLITMFAIEVGNTLSEMKTDLKRECDFMVYRKNSNQYLKRSSDLDTKEMTDWIDWIRNKAGMNGIYLPTPDDYHRNWEQIEQEIEANKKYL